ncbi:GntR family transcriptional regulator [Pedobacter sp. SL55]|uniref:GntR family transcriptional regulator n=1 Tax=Pedobacter sp. SL55 TaxID=2995161 RepID=UPI0022704979|nr:GntR family transcriptional regulator [Pedobacter sp. SL55]WAC39798.1 GntR family transcriptional regulator [Pedobacter sp. SL55]
MELAVFEKINSLDKLQSLSKHEKIVQGILDAINNDELQLNDPLPSVNKMIGGLGFARETIVRAYKDLIERGIIASKNRKGYFVINGNIRQQQKIAMVLYAFDTFQEALFKSFKAVVGEEVQIDLFFHHNNSDVFEAIFNQIAGNYSLYIVAPIANDRIEKLLLNIPVFKLLIIDRYIHLSDDHSYVVQEFEKPAYEIFQKLKDKFSKYEEIVFFFRENTAEPNEIVNAFNRFLKDSGLKGRIESSYKVGSIEKNKVYFTIHNPELYSILKDVMKNDWELGKDLAVLSHNDDIVKEIISGGITTFSTDFVRMGEIAANYAIERNKVQQVLPTELFLRQSL